MDKVIPVKGMRKIIADRMVESLHTSPSAAHFAHADMTNETAFRQKLKEKYGRKFSPNVVFAMVVAKALVEFPYVNASYVDDTIVLHEDINVGFAVAVNGGVLVVNVKNCDKKGFVEVAEELERLFTAARTNKLKYEDITGSTFSIASMAIVEDIVFHVPIINQPELAILGVYKTRDTPVVEAGKVVVKPMMYVCGVTDHRVLDGLITGQFVSRIKYYIEHPEKI